MNQEKIVLKKVCVHNLKNIDLSLNKNELIVFTGVSGSGKSSLAFDTIYAEGQRRYVESLSLFARRQMESLSKPDLEHASGISPTISIEQKTAGRNPRSTVGTLTEIYDYLRLLYARVAVPHCPISHEPVYKRSKESIIAAIENLPQGMKAIILAPYARGKKAEFKEDFQDLIRKGFMRARVDGRIVHLEESVAIDGQVAHDVDIVIDRLTLSSQSRSRLVESVLLALEEGKGSCIVLDDKTSQDHFYSMHAYSQKSGLSYPALEPHDFSFNSPLGMCPRCQGMGTIHEFDLNQVIDPNLSIAQDCCRVASSYQTVRYGNIYDNLAELFEFDINTPWKKLSSAAKQAFLYGIDKKWVRMEFVHPVTGATWSDYIQWRGVLYDARTRYAEAKSDSYRKKLEILMSNQTCPDCLGERLKPYPAAALFQEKRISDIVKMTISECLNFFETINLTEQETFIASEVLKEIRSRLHFLKEVGLHYLCLDRTAPTLSGGESQRVRLASQIGCGLVGITYILDEPSIGLHPRDNQKLIATLKHLRDMGNSVIVVEHDEETIWQADHIVDFGPGAGVNGGQIIVDGKLRDLLENKDSLTGGYLSGKLSIDIPKKRRKKSPNEITITGACHHNLKNLTVKIPLGILIAVTGVSGSGKSSLISDILHPALSNALHGGEQEIGAHSTIKGIEAIDKVIAIDQTAIGRSPRSNPATYIKVFDEIRDLFSRLPESLARGYKPGRFSFNVKEGSCTHCEGMGLIKIDMDFMEDAWVDCPLCKTRRFDAETLSILYHDKNIHDILEMDVNEACDFFTNIPSIKKKLSTLKQVGMEYIKLGQSSTTLSGGEAQRIKLAKELARPSTGKTLYILDEPTTGLHFHDIKHLLGVLQALVEKGNTVLVIEHNMDVVKTADWIIDLGPEGGIGGGEIVATGTPEKIAKMDTPTGKAVYHALNPRLKEKCALVFQSSSNKAIDEYQATDKFIRDIHVTHAEQNNLKNLDITIPREKITICSGPSGSGKSSFAFETLYAEGQRRYVESLSPYARQFVKQMPKPKVGHVSGLSPAIAIEQKIHAGNPRSTVGTMTEIYDYLRILYARLGIAHCPETGEVIEAISKEHVLEQLLTYPQGEKLVIMAPMELAKQESFAEWATRLQRQGFMRIVLNGEFYQIDQSESILLIPFDRKRKNRLFLVIDRLKVDPTIKSRLFEAIEQAAIYGHDKLAVLCGEIEIQFNLSFAVKSTGKSYPEITPHTFAFNTQDGMCQDCTGLGFQYGANLIQDPSILHHSIISLMKDLWQLPQDSTPFSFLMNCLKCAGIEPYTPLHLLSHEKIKWLFQGSDNAEPIKTPSGLEFKWTGINHVFAKAAKSAYQSIRESIQPYLEEQTCLACKGARINPLARHVTIQNLAIQDVCGLPIEESLHFIESIKMDKQNHKLLEEVYTQLMHRLRFLCEVGLHYLSLDRRAPSLSGGEAQRIRLARQLGSGLTGVLYVLDEPTIGLHPKDNARLNHALQQLKALGNTLVMVEHDPLTVATADYLLDFGPKSGLYGGEIVAQGTIDEILQNPASLTGAYLSGRKNIEVPANRRPKSKIVISIKNASLNNLKSLDVDIPVGIWTCLTGVSGSGKSTLMQQILRPAFERMSSDNSIVIEGATVSGLQYINKLIVIDQNPIGQTNRSDVGTYSEVLERMRDFFITLPAAKTMGLQPKHFSCNHRKGMCTGCFGLGYRKVEMHFLPAIQVICEECHGLRLNPQSLQVKYLDKNFGQYLDSTIDEVRLAFEHHPKITRILDTLIAVGLGYLKLGQETATLSGGESQRLKLSRELAKRSTGQTLYLLDEPTTGLHADDIQKLLVVLNKLVDKGNTLIIIEHQLDMIKSADYIIDLGPEAGEKGGHIIAKGTPEEIAANKDSVTGAFLKPLLPIKKSKIVNNKSTKRISS